jgi:hypothetical protein
MRGYYPDVIRPVNVNALYTLHIIMVSEARDN